MVSLSVELLIQGGVTPRPTSHLRPPPPRNYKFLAPSNRINIGLATSMRSVIGKKVNLLFSRSGNCLKIRWNESSWNLNFSSAKVFILKLVSVRQSSRFPSLLSICSDLHCEKKLRVSSFTCDGSGNKVVNSGKGSED